VSFLEHLAVMISSIALCKVFLSESILFPTEKRKNKNTSTASVPGQHLFDIKFTADENKDIQYRGKAVTKLLECDD